MKEPPIYANGHTRAFVISISTAIVAGGIVFAAGKWSGGMDRELIELKQAVSRLDNSIDKIETAVSTSSGWRAETTAALASQLSIINSIQRQQEKNLDTINALSAEIRSQRRP